MIRSFNQHHESVFKEVLDTLAGGVGFLLKESEDPNKFDFSVLLKKSSDEVPLKGSLSLKGSAPNGSRRKDTTVRT